MKLDSQQILALLAATSFAAGLNVYATVATLGLLGHYQVLPLPPQLSMLQSWTVIGIALAMFVVEFFADKIPYFDMLWNVLHTFVRIPVAAYIAWSATSGMAPQTQLLATALGGAIAAVAHTGKTAVRASVTPSPEPVSNIALSTAEDAGAIGLTWLATRHPYIAGGATLLLVIGMVMLAHVIIKSIKAGWRTLRTRWSEGHAA